MDGDSSCELCPKGATCTPNSTTASLVLLPGYWRLSTRTDALYACAAGDVLHSACAGGAAVCHLPISIPIPILSSQLLAPTPGRPFPLLSSPKLSRHLNAKQVGDASCAPGYSGALCEWCLDEQTYWDREVTHQSLSMSIQQHLVYM